MFGTASAPSTYQPPNLGGTPGAQLNANIAAADATARINRVNQVTPFGSQQYKAPTEPGGLWSSETTLAPGEQANLEKQRGLTSSILTQGQQRLDALPGLFGGKPLDASAYNGPNSATTDALYGAYKSRLDPQWAQGRNARETQLANQGITLQSNPLAYNNAFNQFDQSKNDAYTQALASAVSQGVAENNNAFGREVAARSQPYNELATLLGMSPGVNTPTFNNAPAVNITAPDLMADERLKVQQEQIASQAEQAKRSANLGAAAGLANAGLSAFGPSIGKRLFGGTVGEAAATGGSLALPAFMSRGANLGMLANEAAAGSAAGAAGTGVAGAGAGGSEMLLLNGGESSPYVIGGAGADTIGGSAAGFGAGLSSFLSTPLGIAAGLAFPFVAGPILNKLVGGGVNKPSQQQVETLQNNLFGPALQNAQSGRNPLEGYTTRYVPLDETGSGDATIVIAPNGASTPLDSFLDALRNKYGVNASPQMIGQMQGLENMPRMVR